MSTCQHPPTRYFCHWFGDTLFVGCCECGAILRGGATLEPENDTELRQELDDLDDETKPALFHATKGH